MTLSLATRFCANCVDLPAVKFSLVGGRGFWLCAKCIAPEHSRRSPGDQPRLRPQVLRIVRASPGICAQDVREQLGMSPGSNRVSKMLERLWKEGLVHRDGPVNHYRYWPASPHDAAGATS